MIRVIKIRYLITSHSDNISVSSQYLDPLMRKFESQGEQCCIIKNLKLRIICFRLNIKMHNASCWEKISKSIDLKHLRLIIIALLF